MNRQALIDRIAKCRQILDANPGSQIFAALAEAHRKIGDLKSALDVCNDGIARHPDYGSAYLVLAKIARDQKRYPEAQRAVERAIELEGHTRSAELLLSEIYLQTGNFQAAEAILTRLAEADPENASVGKLLTLARKAGLAAALQTAGPSQRPLPPPAAPESRPAGPRADRSPAALPSAPKGPPPPAAPAPGPGPDLGPARAEPWAGIFALLAGYPHLSGKLAVGFDGMLLESDLEVRSEAEASAAMAAELFAAVGDGWPGDRFGALQQILIESPQSIWWLWPFDSFILVLRCEPALNMGPLKLRISQLGALPAGALPKGGS